MGNPESTTTFGMFSVLSVILFTGGSDTHEALELPKPLDKHGRVGI